MNSYINIGIEMDCTITELAETVAQFTGFKKNLVFDITNLDGTHRVGNREYHGNQVCTKLIIGTWEILNTFDSNRTKYFN